MRVHPLFAALSAVAVAAVSVTAQSTDAFRFRSGVELVNVTATVTDETGRFVSGLRKEDFVVYDDGAKQDITYFSNDRVPVSLGILLDASGSMTSDKIATAKAAIDRFIYDLLGKDDELFFMEFANHPRLTQQWTRDRRMIASMCAYRHVPDAEWIASPTPSAVALTATVFGSVDSPSVKARVGSNPFSACGVIASNDPFSAYRPSTDWIAVWPVTCACTSWARPIA